MAWSGALARVLLVVGALGIQAIAVAQVRDTLRTRADSLRADSLRADSLRRARTDSLAKARQDSIRSDSLMKEDLETIRRQQIRADSIKVPTPAAEMPRLTEHPGVLRWNREQLGASGALTLGDLLEGVPGMTVFRTGWLASPEQAAFLGDFGAVRIFQDGIELEALDRRTGGIHDLSVIPIWPLEEVRIERGAIETRVYLQTWRVQNTTPSTRVDVGNGDLQTNAYRGYFGRRFTHGEVLQAGGQQFSTRDPRGVGDGDQLSLFARAGWAKGRWGFDATWLRTRSERERQARDTDFQGDDLTPIDLTNSDVVGRIAYNDRSRGLWAQVIAASLAHRQSAIVSSGNNVTGTPATDTTTDSTAFKASSRQYVAAVGWERDNYQLSATVRSREIGDRQYVLPMFRGGVSLGGLALVGVVEHRDELDAWRMEGSARHAPFARLALSGAVARTMYESESRPGVTAFRGEAAWRLGRDLWVGGGMVRRDGVTLPAPVLFDTAFRATVDSAATGYFVTARGKFWKDVGADVVAMRWGTERGFRPRYQTRSRVYIDTDWRSRFPSGNLNILFAVTHDYRTQVPFRLGDDEVVRSSQYRLIGFLLEIKLLQATLSYQFRNVINEQYSQIPGFLNARATQFYGVRWNFFN